jgi:hypothetical protein
MFADSYDRPWSGTWSVERSKTLETIFVQIPEKLPDFKLRGLPKENEHELLADYVFIWQWWQRASKIADDIANERQILPAPKLVFMSPDAIRDRFGIAPLPLSSPAKLAEAPSAMSLTDQIYAAPQGQ